jgi:hypothetical protein
MPWVWCWPRWNRWRCWWLATPRRRRWRGRRWRRPARSVIKTCRSPLTGWRACGGVWPRIGGAAWRTSTCATAARSRSTLVDGYKRHVLTDLDSGLVPAVGITPANAPEATVTGDIAADLAAQDITLVELPTDRAYLASTMVRERGEDLAVYCKAWRVGNAGRFTKADFRIDFDSRQLTCPNDMVMAFAPGRSVHFPKAACAACPLGVRCTTSSTGRSVAVHPDEALLVELRQRHQTPQGRARLRERTKVEHSLAHIGYWQGRRARYLGPRKNLFDLRRAAVVHNLHVIARQPSGTRQTA